MLERSPSFKAKAATQWDRIIFDGIRKFTFGGRTLSFGPRPGKFAEHIFIEPLNAVRGCEGVSMCSATKGYVRGKPTNHEDGELLGNDLHAKLK